jgi:hypothetical protein
MRVLMVWLLLGVTSGAGAECNRPWDARPDLRTAWLKSDCHYQFPKRAGFAGTVRVIRLKPGTMVDRFGFPGGRFLAPDGETYMGRSIPYDRLKIPYQRYEVVRPFRVTAGRIAAWFDQPGGGMQFQTDRPVQALIDGGYLKPAW